MFFYLYVIGQTDVVIWFFILTARSPLDLVCVHWSSDVREQQCNNKLKVASSE